MPMSMNTGVYEPVRVVPRNRSTRDFQGNTNHRSTRLFVEDSASSSHESHDETIQPDVVEEPRANSRVAYYGARREMQRRMAPLRFAMIMLFVLCLGLLGFGVVHNWMADDTTATKTETYDPVTIQYNQDITPTIEKEPDSSR